VIARAVVLAAAALAAVAWPLLTYTLTLAAFGAVHVLCELRYVDLRFGPRIERRLRIALLAGVGLIAAGRLARSAGLWPPAIADVVELAIGVGLVALVIPTLRRARCALLAAVIGAALAIGAAVSPVHALLAIAVLHNLTPVGFLAEAAGGRRALAGAAVVFVAVPLLIATGLPYLLLAGVAAPEASLLPAGPLASHLGAYLPAAALDHAWTLHAFSACVFLQCAHYVYVIDVLPRGLPADARGTLPWPAPPLAIAVLVGAAVVAIAAFAGDFADARARYGALAALHAWLEVPVLLLAITPARA
jgi:hypothetical protein